jgi:hypothetical protein
MALFPSSRTRARAVLALALSVFLAGCGLIQFDVAQDLPAQTVPGSPLGDLLPSSLFSVPINIDLSAVTKSHGTGPAKSANLKSLTFSVTMPADGNFDFMDSVSINIAAPGLPDQVVANLPSVPRGQITIRIPPTPGVDLLPYIQAGAQITATGGGHLPARDTTYVGKVIITVHV